MSCQMHEQIPSLLDGRMMPAEEGNALAHLESCRTCHTDYQSLDSLRRALGSMARPRMPEGLTERLRVIASHEREIRARRASLRAWTGYWLGRLRLQLDNVARPVALPFAGGLLSALVMFAAVSYGMPRLAFPTSLSDDVPTVFATDPEGEVVDWIADHRHYYDSAQEVPQLVPATAPVSTDAAVVLLLIDPQGRVADYMTPSGQVTKEMKSMILLSQFTPATIFGQPTWGYKLVLFPRTPGSARS